MNVPVQSLGELEELLLQQRAVSEAERAVFYAPTYEQAIHAPEKLFGMELAVERLKRAGKKEERVLVYGDYDTDGLTSAAIVTLVLRQLGARVTPFIPHRFDDGYGLNQRVLQELLHEFDVVVTVDCGVSNVAEIAWAVEKGKDVIVVDHHELPVGDPANPAGRLPPALAVLHPRHPEGEYPFGYLSGAGVSWKLAAALLNDRAAEQELLDLALLGTVADMVPLLGENRALVTFGLERLRTTTRPGIKRLLQEARLSSPFTTEQLSWRVIPQLNAAGKMDHAQPALDLLLADDVPQAERAVQTLLAHNRERRRVTTRVLAEAEVLLGEVTTPCIFAADVRWPAGVVGLVAGRLSQKHNRPAVVVGGNGRHGVGSARGPEGMSVLELLRTGEAHLLKLGGHARAAGFSVEESNIGAFHEALQQAPPSVDRRSGAGVKANTVIATSLIDWRLLQLIERFAPFGQGNERPLFVARQVPLVSSKPVGASGKHVKCVFDVHGQLVEGIGFGIAETIPRGVQNLDILFQVEANEWRGRRSLQLNLKEVT